MKEKIKEAMQDMLMKNKKCDYTFVKANYKFHQKNMLALDAYVMAYKLSKFGPVDCYMAPNGIQAAQPIFSAGEGILMLNHQVIGIDQNQPTPKEIFCAVTAEGLVLLNGRKLTTAYNRAEEMWNEDMNGCMALLKKNCLI